MTSTAHALVGAAIAAKFQDPVITSSIAFTSHFVMDSIPHWDFGTNWRKRSKIATGVLAIAETLFGITVAYLLFAGKAAPLTLILGISMALLPDWMEAPYYLFFSHPKKNGLEKHASFWEVLTYRIYKVENFFHTKAQFPVGLFTQVATVVFFLYLLL